MIKKNQKTIIFITLCLLLSFFSLAWADVSLKLEPDSGYVGNSIKISGVADSQAWVSIKVLNTNGNIVYFNSVMADTEGNYSDDLIIPDVNPGELKVVAGYGNKVKTEIIIVKKKSKPKKSKPKKSKPKKSKVSDESEKHSVDEAIEKGEKNEAGQLVATVEIKNASEGEYKQDIPNDYFEQQNKLLKLQTPIATVTLPDNMFKEKPKGKVELTIHQVPIDKLPKQTKQKIEEYGVKHIIDINMLIGSKKASWSNENVEVEIAIPYKPTKQEKENPDYIIAVYITDDGEIIPLKMSNYDKERGAVILKTNHFSYYGIQYIDKDFKDLENYSWAKQAIQALAARGIINGITSEQFAPQKDITRADFVVLITRLFDLEGEVTENFTDVEKGTYYYNAVGIAKQMGIVTGTQEGSFNPLQSITRQDMMVIIKRALQKTGNDRKLTANSGKSISDFDDSSKIASYAKESVDYLISKGIISGDGNNINPKINTTRAEAAVLLYRIYHLE